MLVYGDRRRIEAPAGKIAALRRGLAAWAAAPTRAERQTALVDLLVEAGELEQGLLDAGRGDPDLRGEDLPDAAGERAARLTLAVARRLVAAVRDGEGSHPTPEPPPEPIERALADLLAGPLPARIEVRVPEGYAFYGLYPETYLQAAEEAFRGGDRPLRIVGLRSIGTSLAAVVAAAAGERATTVSVRPAGHPFARRLELSPRLARELLDPSDASCYAVVDEGPGLSGSSFGCVADWLEDHGVAPEAISFFPSHGHEPGPYASERHRRRWRCARRHTAAFEDLFLAPSARWPLARWTEDLTGAAEGPLVDLSAGRWREELFPAERPAADLQGERRKLLLAAGGRRWLLKFAGLGRYGREKLALARQLAGLIPPVAGLRHGFLVGPWLDGARPLPAAAAVDRRRLLAAVARYLACRASRLPAGAACPGATAGELFEMLAWNARQALPGEVEEDAFELFRKGMHEAARLARPILSDNKMHAWEWLVTPEGEILKADALDHCLANDLVGPQDVAWDVAGAAVELELDPDELAWLAAAVAGESGGVPVEGARLGFYLAAYLAFQTGRHVLAARGMEGWAPEEATAMQRAADSYAARLRRALAQAGGSQ